jgi:hypothetical protein
MSAYHELKTQYKDAACLVDALGDMGYNDVEMHENAVNLVGFHGDIRPEKANIIVRRKNIGSAANDIGFVKRADGTFGAIISDYDSGKHNTSWLNGLKRSYTEKVAIKTAAKNGFKYLGKKVVAGRTQLQWLDMRS